MNFKGYREVNVPELKVKLEYKKTTLKLNNVDIASKLGTTSQTIDNAFDTTFSKRDGAITFKVSDRILCKVASVLGINLAIVETGTKQYFINLKK